jgi:hypothetical protein
VTPTNAGQAAIELLETMEAELHVKEPLDEVGTFLAALAAVLRETTSHFEDTVGRITDIVTTRESRPNRDLVMTLQDFDRLQQEFVTLSEVLAQIAATSSGSWSGGAGANHSGHEAIAAISISGLKTRLLRSLDELRMDSAESQEPAADDVVF